MGHGAQPIVRDAVEQLAGLGEVDARSISGGALGLYIGDDMFGIVHQRRLYFRTDERTAERYHRAGEHALALPRANGRHTILPFYGVPHAVREDGATFTAWARDALTAARAIRPS